MDLAVAVVLGAAAASVLRSLVADIVSPLVGMLLGEPSFSSLKLSHGQSIVNYGSLIDACLGLVTTAAAVFFLVVKPRDKLKSIAGVSGDEQEPTEAELLAEIRDLLKERPA